MNRNRFLLALAALLFLLAGGILWYWFRPAVRQVQGQDSTVLGEFAAAETAKLLANQGRVLVVQLDYTFAGLPRFDGPMTGFRSALRQHGIAVTNLETLPAKRGDSTLSARFTDLVRKNSNADAVVVFGGAYGLSLDEFAALPAPRPKLISVLAFDGRLKPLFEAGLVHLAIARHGAFAKPPDPQAGRPDETSEPPANNPFYDVVTAANAATLPDAPQMPNAISSPQ
ncbi:MAG: hypothetical protein PCFJNLEI_02130 [Verrucomicrobiae bacterium]|nr:hypothetical protein [Verrucomicrobiae bacterium]